MLIVKKKSGVKKDFQKILAMENMREKSIELATHFL